MKVLHINSYCSDSKFYKNLFVKQQMNGISNTAYIPVNCSTDTETMDFGENSVISKTFSKFDRLTFFRKHKKILKDIQEKIDVSEYDLMHSHSLFSNGYIAYMLYKKYGIPYVTAVRSTDINFFFKYFVFLRKMGVEILKNARKVVFISPSYKENGLVPYVKDYHNSEIFKKSIVIPNGVDDFWIDNLYLDKCDKSETGEIRVLCVARISKRKNIPALVEACKKITDKGYRVKLTVIGKIEDNTELEKILKCDFVEYVSPCNKEMLIKYYRENDIFALLSHSETFGLVYLEAMSQGLPVIYTRGQGFDGQLPEDMVGYASSDRNIAEISEKILMAYKNREKLSKNCVANVQEFNWDNIVKKYCEIYNEII